MEHSITTYVEYFTPGSTTPQSRIDIATSRNIADQIVPFWASALRFFEVVSAEIQLENGGKVLLKSEPIHDSKNYYLGGKLLTLAELQLEFPKGRLLILNMKHNHWRYIVLTSRGDFVAFLEGDQWFAEAEFKRG